MKIVLFHASRLPPPDYGGVERVVLWLTQGLVELGHEVYVAAHAGSRLPSGAKLIELDPAHSAAMDLLPKLPPGADIVHFHAPPEPEVWEKLPCGGVVTIHGNGKPGEEFPLNSIFISQDHASRHGASRYVYNGINPSEYRFGTTPKSSHFLFLSKTSWKVKNVRGAAKMCRMAGAELWVAGGNRPFLLRARAALSRRLRWIGPVSGEVKADLLASAKALVFPVLWSEPFGLVVVEALVSGTPVLAASRGSLPELVSPEVGAIVGSDQEWLDWLSRDTLPWEPEACRDRVMRHFHYRIMAEQYVKAYQEVSAGTMLHAQAPRTSKERPGLPELPER